LDQSNLILNISSPQHIGRYSGATALLES